MTLYTPVQASVIISRAIDYPTPEQIAQQHAELLQMLRDLSRQQANGRSVGGRYNKHDTARLRCIKDIALRGRQARQARGRLFGKLVPEDDLRMLRLAPQNELVGPDKVAMDAWAQKHGRDPRSQQPGEQLTEQQQTTLFAWAARNAAVFAAPLDAQRGKSKAYVLHFGAYKGFRLWKLVTASHSGSKKKLLPHASNSVPEPGDYLEWVTSSAFGWRFPYHVHLYEYCALRDLEENAAWVWSRDGGSRAVGICTEGKDAFRAHAEGISTPDEGERDPYAGGPNERSLSSHICGFRCSPPHVHNCWGGAVHSSKLSKILNCRAVPIHVVMLHVCSGV